MHVYNDSLFDKAMFNFENIITYFKNTSRSICTTLIDPFLDKIQYLSEDERKKYTKFIINVITQFSASPRIVEK